MAVRFGISFVNDLQTNDNEVNLDDQTFDKDKQDVHPTHDNYSESEFSYGDNEEQEFEEDYSNISMEKIEEKTREDLKLPVEEDTVQLKILEPILSEDDFSHLIEIPDRIYFRSSILRDNEDEYKEDEEEEEKEEEEEEDWEYSYQEEEEEDRFSYYKESDKEKKKIVHVVQVARKTFTIEERMNLIMQIRSVNRENKMLRLKNSYLHKNCCDILVAYLRMDTVDKGLDQAMVHNDLRYKVALEEYSKTKSKIESRKNVLKISSQNLEDELLSLESIFRKIYEELTFLEFETAFGLRITATGRRLSEDETKKLIEKQSQRSLELTEVRTTCIRYQNILKNINNKLRKLESLGLGLTTKYYGTQLRHKQSLMDKVEEQRENTRKLQKKYFTYPAILNYLRESTSCAKTYISEQKKEWEELNKIEESIRSNVVDLGRKRTIIRAKNNKLQNSLGFLKDPIMLKQLEVTKSELMKKSSKRNQ